MGAARSVKIHPQVAAQSQAHSQAAACITSHSPYHRNRSQDSSLHRHSATTDQSSMSTTNRSRYHSDASSAIFGDFIPIDTSSMVDSYTGSRSSHSASDALRGLHQNANPYEFEPGTPYNTLIRQTTFGDFMQTPEKLVTGQQQSHKKNAESEGNTLSAASPGPADNSLPAMPKSRTQNFHRSESSPAIVPGRFSECDHRYPIRDTLRHGYGRTQDPMSPRRRGRQQSGSALECEGKDRYGTSSRSALPRRHIDYSPDNDMRSSAQQYYQREAKEEIGARPSPRGRYDRESLQEPLIDDLGREHDNAEYELIIDQPKKRSRSPMKKMFGEHGWLGRSPNEISVAKLAHKDALVERKQDNSRKITMMGKIMSKIEEFAEKADMTPIKPSRSSKDKLLSPTLTISISPPEQAGVYMEIELMLVITANTFLMDQFSQGRMSVDSIKKTVDTWKARGRPVVTQFMYDQATQRDLVAVNQHNFRFYSERAGNSIRVNSMLYNWKQVAGLMAIRTFCNADTIISKLIFDVEQILELLGAIDKVLLRLQQIRAQMTEKMRTARQKENSKGKSYTSGNSGQGFRAARNPIDNVLDEQPTQDHYGGMKLVPEAYIE